MNRVILILLLILFGAGCKNKDVAGQKLDIPETCIAQLKEFKENYEWSTNDELGHSSFTAPAATFEINKPEKYKGKNVTIIFSSKSYIKLQQVMRQEKNGIYQIQFPSDFFDSKTNTISVEHIKIITKIP